MTEEEYCRVAALAYLRVTEEALRKANYGLPEIPKAEYGSVMKAVEGWINRLERNVHDAV